MLQNLYKISAEKYQRKQNVQKLLDKQQLNVLKYV